MTKDTPSLLSIWITKERSNGSRYGLAILFSFVALCLNWVLHSQTERNLFFLSISAVTASASLCGFGPGLLTTLITSLGLNFFFLGDLRSFHFESNEDLIRILLFVLTGGLMTILGGTLQSSLRATRKAQLEAEEAIRARDEFISIVSHELKTPLTSLKLQTQLALRALTQTSPAMPVDRAKQEKTLLATSQTLSRAERLIEDMLDFARIAHGKMSIEAEPVEADKIARSAIESLLPELTEKGVLLRTDLEAGIVGTWDPIRIEQIILNLLSNALKYGAGSPIDVSLKRTGENASISVTDKGPGISPENQKNIFERFERATASKTISGLGLGLYITKNIIELHHGKLWLESALGKGTTFYVELPLNPIIASQEDSQFDKLS